VARGGGKAAPKRDLTERAQRGEAATKGVGYRESTYEHASGEFYDAGVTFTMKSMMDMKG